MPSYFYTDDDKKIIKEEFLTTKAIQWAKSFIAPKKPNSRDEVNPELKSTQLRRFHVEAKALEEKCKHLEFVQIRPLIKMLKSKVAYACPINGKERKIPNEFKEFIDEMVDNIHDDKDFKAFALCFEAVVGYFYGQGGRP